MKPITDFIKDTFGFTKETFCAFVEQSQWAKYASPIYYWNELRECIRTDRDGINHSHGLFELFLAQALELADSFPSDGVFDATPENFKGVDGFVVIYHAHDNCRDVNGTTMSVLILKDGNAIHAKVFCREIKHFLTVANTLGVNGIEAYVDTDGKVTMGFLSGESTKHCICSALRLMEDCESLTFQEVDDEYYHATLTFYSIGKRYTTTIPIEKRNTRYPDYIYKKFAWSLGTTRLRTSLKKLIKETDLPIN